MKKVFTRPKSLKETPFHYCPGCGHSIIHRLVAEVIDELGIRENTIGVPPAGCAVLAYNYFDVDMAEAPHGRAAAVATGIKRMLPDRWSSPIRETATSRPLGRLRRFTRQTEASV